MEKLNIAILIFPDVEILDFAGPYEVFSRTRLVPGVESRRSDESAPSYVFTVAKTTEPIRTTGGLQIIPHHSFESTPRIDVLVVPGGVGTRSLLSDTDMLEWIKCTAVHARKVTSVCTGSLLLAQAGLLRGRTATTHWAALDLLESLKAEVKVDRERRVVDDGIITSAGVASGIDMAFYLVDQLFGEKVADETAGYIEYRRVQARDWAIAEATDRR
jgi:transcriptional regulator GlxA family with amidase domain